MTLRAHLLLFLGCFWVANSFAGAPESVGTVPPTCLSDLVFLNSDSNLQRYCNPDKFIEIEFKLEFGCISPGVEYFLDHGIRLEVIYSSGGTDWVPVRFYAANLTMPSTYTSLVNLEARNQSVSATSLRYTSSLSLKLLDVGKTYVIKEYLCGNFTNLLHSSSTDRLRLRWMQRFGRAARRNEAPWMLDDISVKLWNGSCYLEVVGENFEGALMENGLAIVAGATEEPLCGAPGNGSALYFRQTTSSTTSTRRSVIFDLNSPDLQHCDGMSTLGNSDQLSCPVEAESNSTASITCSAGGAVKCSCRGGMDINNLQCDAIPTTVETTAMATTSETTTVKTVTETTTPSPEVIRGTLEIFEKNVTEEAIADVVSLFPPGGVPKEVTEVVISATTNSLKTTSVDSDPSAGGRILNSLDLFALRGYNSSFGEVNNDLYSFDVEDFEEGELLELDDEIEIEGIHNALGGIDIPGELFLDLASDSSSIRMASFIYKNLSGVLPANTENGTNVSINSPVVSATLGCGSGTCMTGNLTLDHPVIIQIHHFKSTDGGTPQCQFFDLQKNLWSTRGCSRNEELSNSTFSYCECKHLTHFAILLSPGLEIDQKNTFALEIIGYVGVSISVLCMVATIFILTFLKPLRGMRTYIHVNLCICLSIAQLFFIVAVDKTSITGLCQAIAIILHYLFLTTFMWMLMEGVVLYVVLIRVFIKKQKRYILGFTLVSYGLPALYLCLTVPLGLAIKRSGRTLYGPSDESDTCWLRYDVHFVWAFICPVIIIILINCGFFIMAMTIMCKHEKRMKDKSKLETAVNWIKTSISLMVVMGITWIIGVLVFHQALLFVAYIFTIVTAFQGAIIFLLFVVFSKQVRDHYGSWWRSKKSESEVLSKLFPSSTDKHSVFSRSGTRNSSTFFSRSMTTIRSAIPDDDPDIKLTHIKEPKPNGKSVQEAKWIVDLNPTEDLTRKEEEAQRESCDGVKVPVEQLEFSASFGDYSSHNNADESDSRHVAIELSDESKRSDINPPGKSCVAAADSVRLEDVKPNGTVGDHTTQKGSDKATAGSVNSVDDVDSHNSHLADAATIS